MKRINVAICGFGRIGQQIAELLLNRSTYYKQKYQIDARLVGVCNSSSGLIDQEGLQASKWLDKTQYQAGLTEQKFLEQVQADVIIETGPSDYVTGGKGLFYLNYALTHSMNAIAVSKGALVVEGKKLINLAHQHNKKLFFSGATAAALPTVDLFEYNLAGCQILEIEGVFTGTTNFILNDMLQHECAFTESLEKAQARGIAEPNSSFDVDGWDTAAKITILVNTVLGADVKIQDIPRQGISHVTTEHIRDWKQENIIPRLVGFIHIKNQQIQTGVELRLVPANHPFAHLQGSNKCIRVLTQEMGEFVVSGGASAPLATAAAALKDFELMLKTGC
ncbi:homoserine dehydrogenase [Acinetobacter baumannii]|uniref:homoserine dehydrogenase n=1 Tax=Acinetobacter baumannii TaxID=470 RepID=UPI00044A9DD1|nr:homoserine dehydrogenase [Acinetobacter baumannii]EXD18564.1 homoserine dehydrogenase family protein [Acinetobacter baumannii 1297]EXE36878.1 homoserine dehydrogenase family protein [Acinetobacter baumannii 1546444]MCT9287918.1 homoserine dehydrogenase [Acinetobacter baumannii]MCV2389701.1 homoserine dehydrogenase [Acinetobacter baumannii]MDC4270218.1 homoserine dehydrogenase [Acinetobacter baumannii]